MSGLADICKVVERSTDVSHINIPQLVGDQSGQVIVKTYNWTTFLKKRFKIVPAIKQKHHFKFLSSEPGYVLTKDFLSSHEEKTYILREKFAQDSFPQQIIPAGLDASRKQYLFQQIREFCTEETKDLVCPDPS